MLACTIPIFLNALSTLASDQPLQQHYRSIHLRLVANFKLLTHWCFRRLGSLQVPLKYGWHCVYKGGRKCSQGHRFSFGVCSLILDFDLSAFLSERFSLCLVSFLSCIKVYKREQVLTVQSKLEDPSEMRNATFLTTLYMLLQLAL